MKQESNKGSEEKDLDPFFGLKYIAYCRSQLTVPEVPATEQDFVNWAKWQLCKERNLLFYDPIWNNYTPEAILVEYFSLRFDRDEEFLKEFQAGFVGVKKDDYDWFEEQERQYLENQKNKQKAPEEEFTDVY